MSPHVKPQTRQCALVRAGSTYEGKQGFTYFHGISAESVGAESLCMHILTIPPGGKAKTHLHEAPRPQSMC